MSLGEEQDFWDVTPHRIKVFSYTKRNNQGQKIYDSEMTRTYRCLIEITNSLTRGTQGEALDSGIVAYCLGTPVFGQRDDGTEINGKIEVPITSEDIVAFINPVMEPRPIREVQQYFDETGNLHNMIVRFG